MYVPVREAVAVRAKEMVLTYRSLVPNIHPTSRAVALQFGLENLELPQSVGKLRVLGHTAGLAD